MSQRVGWGEWRVASGEWSVTKDPNQVRLETALRIAWADPETPPLAFRAVLGRYKAALQAQDDGLQMDWATMAALEIPLLQPEPAVPA